MTNEQAILHLMGVRGTTDSGQMQRAVDMAVKALDKQTKKKPIDIRKTTEEVFNYYVGVCPECSEFINEDNKYCPVCGQAIDWREE